MNSWRSQQGAVLVVSLIVLLVLTMIGVSAARSVLLEEKMTFASRDAKVALEVAEALTRQGEQYIDSLSTTGDFGASGWRRTQGDGPDNMLDASTWNSENSTELEVDMLDGNGNKLKGRLYIELAGNADKEDPANDITVEGYGQTTGGGEIKVFRIVALGRGYGGDDGGTERIIISHYGKRF
ncbi:PilX N-terminal domain-containing pilus assembly protein [Microbulbifer sp. SAOS-129_SWC]|uniref:pilus assembly PilX family protein n=1 Tax=Microbulbifer sp. SAOS-129_SWC TaxID=3145235 RepID=UPI003217A891